MLLTLEVFKYWVDSKTNIIFNREESLKEKLLRKKLERQAEEAKKDVKLEDFSDEEYDTHRRFQGMDLENFILNLN